MFLFIAMIGGLPDPLPRSHPHVCAPVRSRAVGGTCTSATTRPGTHVLAAVERGTRESLDGAGLTLTGAGADPEEESLSPPDAGARVGMRCGGPRSARGWPAAATPTHPTSETPSHRVRDGTCSRRRGTPPLDAAPARTSRGSAIGCARVQARSCDIRTLVGNRFAPRATSG